MAKAIVRAARIMTCPHKEMHSDVEYVVAHGIASKVGRYRVRIGSAHYIFDDEKTKFLQMNKKNSTIYQIHLLTFTSPLGVH